MKKFLIVAALVAVASPAFAQLPPVIEGFQNPVVVGGMSYLSQAPVDPAAKRANIFVTANIPGIKVGSLPLYIGGIGVTGGALDPSLQEVQFGASIPLVTWAVKSGQFVFQAGYTKLLTGVEKPDGFYGGVGFSLTSPAKLAHKRMVRDAKKAGKPVPCSN
jgi:hypothetical protein